MGEAAQCPWAPKLPFRGLKLGGGLGYTEALSLTLGEKKLPTLYPTVKGSFVTWGMHSGREAGIGWKGLTPSFRAPAYQPVAAFCLP